MDIKRFGNRQGKTIMLLHGNLMCWRQFENLIPLLEKKFCEMCIRDRFPRPRPHMGAYGLPH